MLVEHQAVPVGLLGVRDIAAPLGLGVLHHLVGDVELGVVLEGIDPSVSDTVRELLLLAPEDVVGKVGLGGRVVRGVESLAENVLLHSFLVDHLVRRVDVHRHLEELLVEKGHTGFKTPRGGGLVGAQAVGQVKVLDAADALGVELLLVGGAVEVEVTAEDLVGTLTRKDHLDAHCLDLARKQVHGSRGTDGGDIVGLEVVDDIRQGVKTILDSEGHDVVLGAEELGHLEGSLVVGRAGKANGEGVELGKEGHGRELALVIETNKTLALVQILRLLLSGAIGLLCKLLQAQSFPLGNGSNKRRVQTAGKENTIRNLSHQPFPDRPLKGLAELLEVDRGLGDLLAIPPCGLKVPCPLASQAVEDVSGGESLDLVADGVEGLQLGSEVDSAGLLGGPALVKGCDTDGVAGGDCAVLLLVVKNEGEHAIEVLGRINAILEVLLHRLISCALPRSSPLAVTHQRNHNLAIRGGLEVVGGLQGLANKTVVVDFAVDGEDNAVIGIGKWLSSALCFEVRRRPRNQIYRSRPTNTDDAEPFMAQNCGAALASLFQRHTRKVGGFLCVQGGWGSLSYSCC